jgi:hypothetical protein
MFRSFLCVCTCGFFLCRFVFRPRKAAAFCSISQNIRYDDEKQGLNFRKNTSLFSLNQRDIFQHVPITSRKPVKPDSKGVPGFFAFWGSSRILANPGAS